MKNQETRGFQSEVKQLLHLMIHSLYSNKEIFLRELISNASDAADKLRFRALSTPKLYNGDTLLRARVSVNKEKRTLTLSDNGIGMSYDEVIDNLGTIAKSGTKNFLASLGVDKAKDSQLIGQFGVGFYSTFIVADKVTVRTRAAGEPNDAGVFWESTGEGDYTIATISKEDRGTEITLHLREGEDEYLDDWKIRSVIRKYSDHIELLVEIENKTKVEPAIKSIKDEKVEINKESIIDNSEINNITQDSLLTNATEEMVTWEPINKAKALWLRSKSEIKDEEYKEFYKYISHDFNDPLVWSHNHVEGKQDYTSLLYIPKQAPWDLWSREHKHGLKLYVHRVFIMDEAEQFLPNYLRFTRGLVDSNDLPLNVSRELLQDTKITQNLRNALTKRVLKILIDLSKKDNEKYQQFWQQFGLILKEGPAEDHANKENITKLLRFASTHNDNSEQTISLEDYKRRMIAEQDKIYFITADSYTAANSSPHLELFRKKKIEVLLLSDRIDEWMMNHLTEFENKAFQSISQVDDSLKKLVDKETPEQQAAEKALAPCIERVKTLLGNRVKDVRLTYRLTGTPAIVTTDSNEMSTQMAKLFIAAGQKTPEVKYILELNPEHELVKRVIKIKDESQFAEWIELFFEQALLTERGALENPSQFMYRMNKLLLNHNSS